VLKDQAMKQIGVTIDQSKKKQKHELTKERNKYVSGFLTEIFRRTLSASGLYIQKTKGDGQVGVLYLMLNGRLTSDPLS